MVATALLVTFVALTPTAFAQINTSYVDYNIVAHPDLSPLSTDLVDFSFPDSSNGPLRGSLVCDRTASAHDRAAALTSMMTLGELINSTGNRIPAIPRLGLPPYQIWNEALHGLYLANFTESGPFSWSTSFPSPILTMAALNRTLIHQIAQIIATQGRAFNNAGRYGLNAFSPNINAFRHPVWGRGQETPGEDANCLCSAYAYEYITGLQGNATHPKIIATAKHYAGYDIENWHQRSRFGNDLNITQQDLAEYFTPQFVVAVRDAQVRSVMPSYNAVNGVPSSANTFLLQTLVRDSWGFIEDGYMASDCDAVYNVFNPHGYAANLSSASAMSLRAGTDIDCGISYLTTLNESLTQGQISQSEIERAVTRFYSNLVSAGYFDGPDAPYRDLSWSDVVRTDRWNVAYEAAVAGVVLLKNDGVLPLSKRVQRVALIGPWANATEQMQGNYHGVAPYLTSPLAAVQASGLEVNYAFGTNIMSNVTTGFAAALAAAERSDVIIFAGGIDNTLEAEELDRENITWPGNQLELIHRLGELGKPLVVLQMGGGQVDSSSLKASEKVGALLWGGYPGQAGGQALWDILTGQRAPAGRLTTTQYPAEYALQFPATDMSLRPRGDNPGQTYMWYTGEPVYAFGHGLFYTTFETALAGPGQEPERSFDIGALLARPHAGYNLVEQLPFLNFTVEVTNTGEVVSDYTAMVFANTTAGPRPHPNKWLVGFDRIGPLDPRVSERISVPVSLDSLARTDAQGNRVIYPGPYELALNNERSAVLSFTLTGNATTLAQWPLQEQ
ncbi:beta-xylosidase [Aspergillus indologenus CBS 114.80]|uniref:xylan 1,4-beta-xylosidase n=1 Tax=Aspergillus indologenus CBS 114.80 TaxID=1450541 RepID=A0A2V5ISU0_9EURO|nr:beta-xylosidase [Aspergillus indologenus CBS 114.80]